MSVELEAFDAVRLAAYRQWGPLPHSERAEHNDEILQWCRDQFHAWRLQRPDGGDLSDAQIESSSRGIANFVINRLAEPSTPKRRKPLRSTEERAWQTKSILIAPDLLFDEGETVSISQIAARVGVSRSRVAWAKMQDQQTPVRQLAAAKLSSNAKKLFECVEKVVPADGLRVVTMSSLTAAIWQEPKNDVARRQQRKRLLPLLTELSIVGYHHHVDRELLVFRRGRRFRPNEVGVAMAAVRSGRRLPHDVPKWRAPGFWSSSIITSLTAALEIACQPNALLENMQHFLPLLGELTDWRPVYHVVEWWSRQPMMDHGLVEFLTMFNLRKARGDRYDPRLDAALEKTRRIIENLEHAARHDGNAYDEINIMVGMLDLRPRISATDNERIDKLLWVLGRDRPLDYLPGIEEAWRLCRELAEIEQQGGDWIARVNEIYPPTLSITEPSEPSADIEKPTTWTPLSMGQHSSTVVEREALALEMPGPEPQPSLPPDPDCPF